MRKDGTALAKLLQEEALRADQAMMSASDPVFTVMGMPYCWKCSKKSKKIKVEMMREQVIDGVHYLLIACHGERDKMRVSNKELIEAQASGGHLEVGWAFKPAEIEESKRIAPLAE